MFLLTQFGSIDLSPYNMVITESPVSVEPSFTTTTAGAFDNDGSGRSRQRFPFPVRYSGVVLESTITANRTLLNSLRAAVGTKARLYRETRFDPDADDPEDVVAEHWCNARLVAMPYEVGTDQKRHREITLEFQQLDFWRGEDHGIGWFFDEGEVFDDPELEFDEVPPTVITPGGITLTINNGGNIPTSNVVVTITAGAADIALVAIAIDNGGVSWTGSLPSGEALTIDGGAHSVTVSGDNAYDGFELGSSHILADWFVLEPGNNSWDVAIDGGSTDSTISIVFYDAWA
jgi:hypothetical protein